MAAFIHQTILGLSLFLLPISALAKDRLQVNEGERIKTYVTKTKSGSTFIIKDIYPTGTVKRSILEVSRFLETYHTIHRDGKQQRLQVYGRKTHLINFAKELYKRQQEAEAQEEHRPAKKKSRWKW